MSALLARADIGLPVRTAFSCTFMSPRPKLNRFVYDSEAVTLGGREDIGMTYFVISSCRNGAAPRCALINPLVVLLLMIA